MDVSSPNGITMGDASGVGPEILLKAFANGDGARRGTSALSYRLFSVTECLDLLDLCGDSSRGTSQRLILSLWT